MFGKLFGRKTEIDLETTKTEVMTDILVEFRKNYDKYAVIAWWHIEDTGDEKLGQIATLVTLAFDVGFYGMAAAFLDAQSLEADFERHPEHVDFGMEVVRQIFNDKNAETSETLISTVMSIVVNPEDEFHPHVAMAYKIGQEEGFNAARAVMDEDFDYMGSDVLKQLLVQIGTCG